MQTDDDFSESSSVATRTGTIGRSASFTAMHREESLDQNGNKLELIRSTARSGPKSRSSLRKLFSSMRTKCRHQPRSLDVAVDFGMAADENSSTTASSIDDVEK